LKPEWSLEMKDIFGDSLATDNDVKPLRTTEQMNEAISETYWYRVGLSLEYPVMFRRRLDILVIPDEEYSMCSDNTKQLATILTDYMTYNCCNGQYINYPSMIKSLTDWIDATYATTQEQETETI